MLICQAVCNERLVECVEMVLDGPSWVRHPYIAHFNDLYCGLIVVIFVPYSLICLVSLASVYCILFSFVLSTVS